MPQKLGTVIDMPDPDRNESGMSPADEQAGAPAPRVVSIRTYRQRPFVGPRKGNRNLYVPTSPAAGSAAELLALREIDPRNLNAVACTAKLTVRVDKQVYEISANDLASTPLREFDCVLRPAAYTSMTNFIGTYKVLNPDGNHAVWFASLTELAHLRELDYEGHRDLNTQFLQITWTLPSGRKLHHYPDIARRADGTIGIVDVTALALNTREKSAVFDLTSRTCRLLGWAYEVGVDDITEARQRNLRFLAAFRHQLQGAPTDAGAPRPVPRTMWSLVQAEGGGSLGWQRACARLWNRELGMDLDRILDDTTPLTTTPAPSPRITWTVTQ